MSAKSAIKESFRVFNFVANIIRFIFAARYCHFYTNIHLHDGLTHVLSLFSALARNTLYDNSPYIPNLQIHFSPPQTLDECYFPFPESHESVHIGYPGRKLRKDTKRIGSHKFITIADAWQKDIRLPVVFCPFAILLKNSERSLALVTFLLLHNLLERNGKEMS